MLPGIRYSVASNRQRYSTNRLKRSRNKVHPPHDLVIWRCPCSGWMYPESLVMCLSSFFPQGLPPKFPGWSLWFAHEISVISWRPTARKPHWLMGLRPWGLFFFGFIMHRESLSTSQNQSTGQVRSLQFFGTAFPFWMVGCGHPGTKCHRPCANKIRLVPSGYVKIAMENHHF